VPHWRPSERRGEGSCRGGFVGDDLDEQERAEVERASLEAVWIAGGGSSGGSAIGGHLDERGEPAKMASVWRPFGRTRSDGGGGALEAVYVKAVGSKLARSLVNMNASDGGRG